MSKFERMSAQDFESQSSRLAEEFSGKTLALARMILVDGVSKTDAAEKVGMSRQNVAKTVERVLARFNKYPRNWVYVKQWMPPEIAEEVKKKIENILKSN